MNAEDRKREDAIEAAYQLLIHARTVAAQRTVYSVMRDLINGRSPERVQEMEQQRGLRR